jgi:hypothetical protein
VARQTIRLRAQSHERLRVRPASINGTFYEEPDGNSGFIFPFPAFERLQQVSEPVLSSIFGYFEPEK